jgi:hypothetical protein
MTRASINDSLWITGILLQSSLLALLFLRGIARRLPIFTGLLAFYLLRSILLLALFGHIDNDLYVALAEGFAVADLFLQLLVALEIALQLVPISGGWTWRRAGSLLLLPCLALVGTLLLCQALPVSRFPPDRFQIFDWLVMVLLAAGALAMPAPGRPEASLLRRLTLGLAAYGLLGIYATAARTLAAASHDARRFAQSAYTLPVVWLLVVLYWIVILKPQKDTAPQPEPLPIPAV